MTDIPPEALAGLDPHQPPLFGEKGSPTHHLVHAHERTLPPVERPESSEPRLDLDLPPPQPAPVRRVPVRRHLRRNRKETPMSSVLPPQTRTEVTAMKDALAVTALETDPHLSNMEEQVLAVFEHQAMVAGRLGGEEPAGFTDFELVTRLERQRVGGSPSGFRTARKSLERSGILEPNGTRPTRSGRKAKVYVLSEVPQ